MDHRIRIVLLLIAVQLNVSFAFLVPSRRAVSKTALWYGHPPPGPPPPPFGDWDPMEPPPPPYWERGMPMNGGMPMNYPPPPMQQNRWGNLPPPLPQGSTPPERIFRGTARIPRNENYGGNFGSGPVRTIGTVQPVEQQGGSAKKKAQSSAYAPSSQQPQQPRQPQQQYQQPQQQQQYQQPPQQQYQQQQYQQPPQQQYQQPPQQQYQQPYQQPQQRYPQTGQPYQQPPQQQQYRQPPTSQYQQYQQPQQPYSQPQQPYQQPQQPRQQHPQQPYSQQPRQQQYTAFQQPPKTPYEQAKDQYRQQQYREDPYRRRPGGVVDPFASMPSPPTVPSQFWQLQALAAQQQLRRRGSVSSGYVPYRPLQDGPMWNIDPFQTMMQPYGNMFDFMQVPQQQQPMSPEDSPPGPPRQEFIDVEDAILVPPPEVQAPPPPEPSQPPPQQQVRNIGDPAASWAPPENWGEETFLEGRGSDDASPGQVPFSSPDNITNNRKKPADFEDKQPKKSAGVTQDSNDIWKDLKPLSETYGNNGKGKEANSSKDSKSSKDTAKEKYSSNKNSRRARFEKRFKNLMDQYDQDSN